MTIKKFFESPSRICLTSIGLLFLTSFVAITYFVITTSLAVALLYIPLFSFALMVALPFYPIHRNQWGWKNILLGFKEAFKTVGQIYVLGELEWEKRYRRLDNKD